MDSVKDAFELENYKIKFPTIALGTKYFDTTRPIVAVQESFLVSSRNFLRTFSPWCSTVMTMLAKPPI